MVKDQGLLLDLLQKFENNKLHQSILLIGKHGIGKATLVNDLIIKIIEKHSGQVDKEQQVKMMKSYSHPDIFYFGVKKTEDQESKMDVEGTRGVIEFMNTMPSLLPAKFAIIDSINEMNNASCNAILKILEEPRNNAYFFVICHNQADIIPTILSRCIKIKVKEPSLQQTVEIINEHIQKSPLELVEHAILSENSPGDSLFLAGINGLELYSAFLQDIGNKTAKSLDLMHKMPNEQMQKLLIIFVNRIYKILNFVVNEKSDISVILREEQFVEYVKKSNNLSGVIYNYSKILQNIKNMVKLNNSLTQTYGEVLYLLNI